ncbi:hypothetical protein EKO04_000902 [Ascochyta lentis]|uniref:MYND-type domain-containing protein n=1 Tax=Ascochyta lentis TaxID=205686 RepID=A0A8H7MMY0_9PLEO|nr:hypothetical protein EKO04_000902 [Ascochyta lentis]
MAEMSEQAFCAMCDKPSTQLCSGCKSIKYCSKSCQKLDWPIHKLICKTYKKFLTSRPDQEHHSMIYFAVNETQPRFIWARIDEGHNHPSREELKKHNMIIDLSDSGSSLGIKPLSVNVVLDRPLGPHLIMFHPPSAAQCCPCCKHTYKKNESLINVDTELADTLRGPILAWAMHHEDDMARKPRPFDLGPMDFRHMVDELRSYYSEVLEGYRELAFERTDSKGGVKGVRLNCKGDQQFLHRPHLEPTTTNESALLEQSLLLTPVADRLGMPLHVLKVAPAPVWRDRQLKPRMHNCCSGYLNPFISIQDDIGSLIITRKDGKELQPTVLQALFNLTSSKLGAEGTQPPFPADRLEVFTEQDVKLWAAKLASMETK